MRAVAAAPAVKSRRKKSDDEDDEAREERPDNLDAATCRQVRAAIESAGAVIFDECHHVPAESFYKIAMLARAASWRIGLSATPWRDDGHDLLLEAALGATVHQTLSSDLIERGYLVAPRIVMAPAPGPRLRGRSLTYPECYQAAIVENRERNRAIAAQAQAWAAQGLSVLILVTQVTHGLALRELLPEANFAHGSVEASERQRFLKELERKLHPILIATTLADEGLDVPTLDAVILGGGGKSPTKAYQRIGRALRPAPGKTVARVLDFIDDSPYLREHSAARLKLYHLERRFDVESPRCFKVT
jgi:superfamily II DNA or RNA helicase